MKNFIFARCATHGQTKHIVDEWVAATDQNGEPAMWDVDQVCVQCQTTTQQFARVRTPLDLAAGMWYRCIHNGYEFMVFVTEINIVQNRAEMQIDDWRSEHKTEWFYFSTIENWHMEYVA